MGPILQGIGAYLPSSLLLILVGPIKAKIYDERVLIA
jgi:hypothetical protein